MPGERGNDDRICVGMPWGVRLASHEGFIRDRGWSGPDLTAPDALDRYTNVLLIVFAAFVAAYLSFGQRLFLDGDTSWHIATGRYILQMFDVPDADIFSFTSIGKPWVAHEWLSEIIMAIAYNLAGWRGLNLLFGLTGGATALLIGRELIRWLPVRWALCVLFVIAQLLGPTALARPHMLVWPLVAGWLLMLLHARAENRAPHFAAGLPMFVWANSHASYIVGLGLAGLFAVDAVARRSSRPRETARWLAFLLVCTVIACVTPHGVDGLLYPFQVGSMTSLSLIGEWRPTSVEEDKLFILVATTAWVLSILNWRKLDFVRFAILTGMTAMAVLHARHQSIFALTVPISIMSLLAPRQMRPPPTGNDRLLWVVSIVLAASMVVLARLAVPQTLRDNDAMPLAALRHLPASLKTRPVFNEYSYGGPLILAGIRPYIDGRGDMYGDAYNAEYAMAIRGDLKTFSEIDRRWRFDWIIIPRASGLAQKLAGNAVWRAHYLDARTIVLLRARRVQ